MRLRCKREVPRREASAFRRAPHVQRHLAPGPPHGAAAQHAVIATPAFLHVPPPPLADQAVLFLRRLASMQQDARDVARACILAWRAEAA